MAIFHFTVTQTKRSKGQSAIASAAYRSGERLYSEYYGEYSDYTRKGGVICSDILLPSHAPKEYADRQTLWNAVEKAERGKNAFSMKIGNRTYTDKKEAGAALIDMCRSAKQPNMAVTIGEFQGFKMSVSFDSFFSKFTISLKGSLSHEVEIGADPLGNLQRLSNALEGMTGKMADVEQKLSNVEHQLETAKVEVTKPFAQEQELSEKLERLAELNALLNMDEKGDNALDMGDDEPEDETGEHSTQAQEGEPDRAEDIQAVADEPLKPVASFLMSERIAEHDKERMLADGSKGRVSVKEKLAEMKQKISDQKMPEKPEVTKSKGKEESL